MDKKAALALISLAVVCLCLTVSLGGCANENNSSLNDLRPMVMIDDRLYLDTGIEEKLTVSPEAVTGEILSTVPQTEKPSKNGQSNFGAVGSAYYLDGDSLMVQINDKWFKFEQDGTN